ncbi:MAG: hypothetical protein HC914_17985 [Chloroflexaceae bacterium]|nr:hypothetical protein [Chloroflexaceae bacterium]
MSDDLYKQYQERLHELLQNLEHARARDLALMEKLDQIADIADRAAQAAALAALRPDLYQLNVDLLAELARTPEYPLLRDESLVGYVFDVLPTLAAQMQDDPSPALHAAGTALLAQLGAWSRGSCFGGLDAALAAMQLPAPTAEAAAWDAFAAQLNELQAQYFDIIRMAERLSDTQVRQLEQYFTATLLLEDCLALSAAAQRSAISESLLLPPGQWQPPDAPRSVLEW